MSDQNKPGQQKPQQPGQQKQQPGQRNPNQGGQTGGTTGQKSWEDEESGKKNW